MKENDKIALVFPGGIYSAESLRLAAYVFAGRSGAQVAVSGLKAQVSGETAVQTAGEFANEVLNQQCRLDLAAGNGTIANMIVTKVLLSVSGETSAKKGKR